VQTEVPEEEEEISDDEVSEKVPESVFDGKVDKVDVENIDGKGTPLYYKFGVADWHLLDLRYHVHLLLQSVPIHSFNFRSGLQTSVF